MTAYEQMCELERQEKAGNLPPEWKPELRRLQDDYEARARIERDRRRAEAAIPPWMRRLTAHDVIRRAQYHNPRAEGRNILWAVARHLEGRRESYRTVERHFPPPPIACMWPACKHCVTIRECKEAGVFPVPPARFAQ